MLSVELLLGGVGRVGEGTQAFSRSPIERERKGESVGTVGVLYMVLPLVLQLWGQGERKGEFAVRLLSLQVWEWEE